MKKIMLAVIASVLVFAASVEAQPRKQCVKRAPSVEQIAQRRSENQAKCMNLNKIQQDKLYKLNLKAAKEMQKSAQKGRNSAAEYKKAMLKIVGVENMKMYEASRQRDRKELQRGPKDARKFQNQECSKRPECCKPVVVKECKPCCCPKVQHCPKAPCERPKGCPYGKRR